MQEWRSVSGVIAAVLWGLIFISGAFGCGNDGPDSVSLPNGYTLSSWDWEETWVEDHNGDRIGDRHYSIAACQVQDNLFFGVYHDQHRNDQRVRSYFIIDTARDKYQPFMDKGKWNKVLWELGGVESAELVPVSTFVSRDVATARMLGQLILGTVIGSLLLIALVVWGYERAHRRMHAHRL